MSKSEEEVKISLNIVVLKSTVHEALKRVITDMSCMARFMNMSFFDYAEIVDEEFVIALGYHRKATTNARKAEEDKSDKPKNEG